LLDENAKTDSLQIRRQCAGRDDNYLQAVITQAA